MKQSRYFLVILILIFLASWSILVAAQSDDNNWSTSIDYEFGQAMHFQLTGSYQAAVESATLFIQTSEFPDALSVTKEITPTQQVMINHELDLTQVRLAPFSTVTYWWLLKTAAGEVKVPERTIVYEDDQFEWRREEGDGVVVHWTGGDPGLGQLALGIADESLPRLATLLPLVNNVNLDIYIYPSSADLRAALRLTGRDWVGAHAHPELGVILVTAVNERTAATDLRQSIPHELTHFYLYRATGANYDHVPLWFNEGLATMMETVPNPNFETILAAAVSSKTTIPFSELCQSFPAVEDRTLLAYAQSASLIRYIQAQYGNSTLNEMVTAFADGADCQSGVNRVLQISLAELNRDWLRRQESYSPFIQFWLDNSLWLLLVAAGFGIIGLLVIVPKRKF